MGSAALGALLGRPGAVLTQEPDWTPLFTGEQVTLRCEVQGGGDSVWSYRWYRGREQVFPSVSTAHDQNTFSLGPVAQSHSGQYSCQGVRRSDSALSSTSSSITLTVTALPRAALRVDPHWSRFYTGEKVSLSCEIDGEATGWKYLWYKDTTDTAVSQTAGRRVTGHTLTITAAAESDRGQYWCRGQREERGLQSQLSDSVSLTVSGTPLKPVLTCDRHQIFTGDSVTLRCELRGDTSTDWRYYWYRDGTVVHQSDHSDTIRAALTDSGQYRCRAGRGTPVVFTQDSDTVQLQVSGRPGAVLTQEPDWTPLFTGEQVTLRCEVQGGGDSVWSYRWYRGREQVFPSVSTAHDQNTFSLGPVAQSHSGQYSCQGVRRSDSALSSTSSSITLTVTALPRAVLRVDPHWSRFYTGEKVSLSCEIYRESTGWKYLWYKDTTDTAVSQTAGHTLTITAAAESDRGQYWCRGQREERGLQSQLSDSVSLTVSEPPTPVLSLEPPWTQVFLLETISLSCEIDGETTGWKYLWYKDTTDTAVSQTAGHRVTGHTLTITAAAESDRGQYWCRGQRGVQSQLSEPVILNITALPKVTLTVSPSSTQHFTRQTVTLRCEVQGGSAGWTVKYWTGRGQVSGCPSRGSRTAGVVCSTSYASESDSGVYWCESTAGQRSYSVTLTVSGGPVILQIPLQPVTEGDSLTLRCLVRLYDYYRRYITYQSTGVFYKDGEKVQPQRDGQMTIDRVSQTDQGSYRCEHSYWGVSPESRVSVRELLSRVTLTASPGAELEEGESLNLTCQAEVTRHPPPALSFVLLRDNSTVSPSTGPVQNTSLGPPSTRPVQMSAVRRSSSGSELYSLLVRRADRSFSGTYRCVVSSHSGVSRESALLHVRVAASKLPLSAYISVVLLVLVLAVLIAGLLYHRTRGLPCAAGKQRDSAEQDQVTLRGRTHSPEALQLSTLNTQAVPLGGEAVYCNVSQKEKVKKNAEVRPEGDILYAEVSLPASTGAAQRESSTEVCYSALNLRTPAAGPWEPPAPSSLYSQVKPKKKKAPPSDQSAASL
ncbi:Fc receptor-like protein 5 isoform X2 [Lepisosteus oculatus]|uniref:Fc receptor-like protein 5 isoform X2 n=1 Tax=Lepisosteus oculatus TaxID=7918 RepID=UPI0037120E8F